jgi:hypothetical protein
MPNICLFICGAGLDSSSLLLRPFIGLVYQRWTIDGDDCGAVDGMIVWHGKPKCSEKTCHVAAPLITDPT